MPSIAEFHPQIVHFVIALFYVGLAFRVVSLTGRLAWTRPAGATLLILAAVASLAAVKSGEDAHGPAERIPGAREAVHHHEETGERARNVLLAVAALELLALGVRRRETWVRGLHAASALAGLAAGYMLYEAAEHGGEVVYEYAGGVGTRSGDTTHVRRLLVAGLFHEARVARESGRAEDAARLTEELVRRMPGDTTVRLLGIESLLRDRGDAAAALGELQAFIPGDEPRVAVRHGLLAVEALRAAGREAEARSALEDLARRFPEHPAVQQAMSRSP